MSDALMNLIRREASAAANRTATARYGIIDTYDPNTFAVKVRVQPEDVITGWLPLGTPWVGSGWGMFAAPTPGDQVLVEFAEGDPESGVLIARLYSDVARPLAVPAGEFWLVNQDGSFLKFRVGGNVDVNVKTDLAGTVGGKATLNVTGDVSATVGGKATLNVSGDVSATVGGKATANVTGTLSATVGGDTTVNTSGTLTATAALANVTATLITITGNTVINGTLSVAGNITTTGAGHKISSAGDLEAAGNVRDSAGTMAAMRGTYNSHTHNDPQGGVVAPPNQPM